jgi:hypothetical protein
MQCQSAAAMERPARLSSLAALRSFGYGGGLRFGHALSSNSLLSKAQL